VSSRICADYFIQLFSSRTVHRHHALTLLLYPALIPLLTTSTSLSNFLFSQPLSHPPLLLITVRESATSVVITFITTYPLGAKRLAAHLKQMITNCAYAYDDGRLSSFEALETLVRLLPLPVLEDNAQSIFLPMALRLVRVLPAVNDKDSYENPLFV
jgi:hypothetical protein